MERERRIWSTVLIILLSLWACTESDYEKVLVSLEIKLCCIEVRTKSSDPDEKKISDLNLLIFDENGFLEESKWIEEYESFQNIPLKIDLVRDKKYNIYACANLGFRLSSPTIDEMSEIRCHLAYPDEYREGIPMSGKIEDYILDGDDCVEIELERLMAKISLRMDRGGLSDDIEMDVISVRIGNCPKSARIFGPSKAESRDECFTSGFSRTGQECDVLNINTGNGISGNLSLYMLENMQGAFSHDEISCDEDKVFDKNDIRADKCSYIEIAMDYRSESLHTRDYPLIYRFYLGEDRNNLDIERNCHYRITVIPEDDGLSDDGWRVDKSGLLNNEDSISFEMTPSGYIQGYIGDKIHVRCEYYPPYAEFDIGLEELEYDRDRGIYDFEIDSDGKGVMLTLQSPGTGIIYMSAKEPVNETGMLVIEVNNIKNSTL